MDNNNENEPVFGGYVEIATNPSRDTELKIPMAETVEEVTLEDVTQDIPEETAEETVAIEETQTPNDGNNSDEANYEEVKAEEPTKKVESKTKPADEEDRPSRAKKRIKQLLTEKTEAAERAAAAEKRAQELEAKLNSTYLYSKTAIKAALEDNLVNLRKNLQDALEDSRADEAVKFHEEMIQTTGALKELEAELVKATAQQQKQEELRKTPPKQEVQVSEKALEWVDTYPQYMTDELFQVVARTVSNQLVSEGFDDETDDFYEELNSRLSPRFPEVFGINKKNTVNYKTDDTNTSDEEEDGNENTSNTDSSSKTKLAQTVSGASRTPPHKKGQSREKETAILSPADVKQAERWGLSLEQVARRIAHNAKNKREDGYTPIIITKS